jgi:hypothetical protein
MVSVRLLALSGIVCVLAALPSRAETWMDALRRMTLPPDTVLNRENCIRGLLEAFQSNSTVQAIAILPGVSDDFYLVNRNKARLDARPTNIGEAICALTNLTGVRATFREGLLLLHLEGEPIEAAVTVKSERQAAKLKGAPSIDRVLWIDRHWSKVQPELASVTKMRVVPVDGSKDAWHFARCNVAAWNVNPWNLITLAGVTSGARVWVQSDGMIMGGRITFRRGD